VRARRGVRIQLEVACGNTAAQRLYHSAGYVIRARLVRYYRYLHHGTHDAFRMLKTLGG
jgi:ribosomal protein S18 acetylase RimI-like enzyme